MKHQLAAMPQAVLSLFFGSALLLITSSHLAAAAVSNMSPAVLPAAQRLGCPDRCGDVEIPYPFGIGDGCAADWPQLGGFNITCDYSFSPPRPFSGGLEVMSITLETGEIRVVSPVSYICYNSSNTIEADVAAWSFDLGSSFLISKRRNMFTAIGCSTTAFLFGREDGSFFTGCISTCEKWDDAAKKKDGCVGVGCCQVGLLGHLRTIAVDWGNRTGSVNPVWNFSPCSYAFVAEKHWYSFHVEDLSRMSFISRVKDRAPMVLDWAITSNESCQIAVNTSGTTRACASLHSECVNATQGNGYLCKCSAGYHGNPYLSDGCSNINECELRKSNLTKYKKVYPCNGGSTCHDTIGSYECKCKWGHTGDGKSAQGCKPIVPRKALVAVLVSFFSVILACSAIVLVRRRRLRKRFNKNGGDLLKEMDIKIYTQWELKKITNGYKTILGEGAFGKVYEGTIHENNGTKRVAVKRSTEKRKTHQEFRKEIIMQLRMISHENLVRLLGCCLEADVPMLVFEHVPNGSLYDRLHGNSHEVFPLMSRLDIAIGSAEALAYMHSPDGHNHVHGDIKSGNILLGDGLIPKVSDFGSSMLMSKSMYVTCVKADRDYIDPVYMKTDRFTMKSDVYSFGVVLLELITRKTPKYDGNNTLSIVFVQSCKREGNGRKMYDGAILNEGDAKHHLYMECLDKIGALAVRCLKEDVDERPSMAEVVKELKEARSIASGGSHPETSN